MNIRHMLRGLTALLFAAPMTMSAQSVEGTSYYLPKTVMHFTVKVEKTSFTPGRFAGYAHNFLRKAVGQEATTSYRLLGLAMTPEAVPDTAKRYTLITDKHHSISTVARTADGLLLAINAEAEEPELELPSFTPAEKPARVDPTNYMSQEMLAVGSELKMAEMTAREIYDIRDSRNQLNRGEADFMPTDGTQLRIMLDNLDRQEQALSSLFEGVTERDTAWITIDFTPEKAGRELLFRFSKHLGVVDADDLAGEPVYAEVRDLNTAKAPDVVDAKKEDKGDIGLRVSLPTKIKVTVSYKEKSLATYTFLAPQMGYVESLSGELFGKKQSVRLLLDPATGAVGKIESANGE